MKKLIGGFSLAVLFASSGIASADTAFSSANDVRTALNKAGVSCLSFQSIAKADRQMGMESAADVGECDIGNESALIAVWKDEGQQENWAGLFKTLSCATGKAFGISTFDYAQGNLWSVSELSQTVAQSVSKAIGGSAVHVECDE